MGLGSFGGGAGSAIFSARQGARVWITDTRTEAELGDSLAQLRHTSVDRWILGRHEFDDFLRADIIIVNPAVAPTSPFLAAAQAAGREVVTDIDLLLRSCPARFIGVTGTNGKSTTATMIASILSQSSSRCWLGGNIGRSLLPELDQIRADDWVVLELSSFQLEHLSAQTPSPETAVVTNLTPNHLDRHGSFAAYELAKRKIVQNQSDHGLLISNRDDERIARWEAGRRFYFSARCEAVANAVIDGDRLLLRDGLRTEQLSLGGLAHLNAEHLRGNAVAAACCCWARGIPGPTIRAGLEKFVPLPHRQQVIGVVGERSFVDDSESTTPESTIAALRTQAKPIWIIVGGDDKGMPLEPLAAAITRFASGVALIGKSSEQLRRLIQGSGCAASSDERSPGVAVHGSLRSGVEWCFRQSGAGDTILLSPGCSSLDMFHNYRHRAAVFRAAVRELKS